MNSTDFLRKLLFIDIETVALTRNFDELDERLKPFWEKKALRFDDTKDASAVYADKAGILAEFGKIVVIGLGFFAEDEENQMQFRVKSMGGDDEKNLLEEFITLLEEKFEQKSLKFVAHNGKDFDYPFLCRRILINGLELPISLELTGKRPWEIKHFDTMEMWRYGESRHYVSLDLLSALFGIPSSKEDIDGSKVNAVYWEDKDLDRIAEYCKNDVIATARIFLKLNSYEDLNDSQIVKL